MLTRATSLLFAINTKSIVILSRLVRDETLLCFGDDFQYFRNGFQRVVILQNVFVKNAYLPHRSDIVGIDIIDFRGSKLGIHLSRSSSLTSIITPFQNCTPSARKRDTVFPLAVNSTSNVRSFSYKCLRFNGCSQMNLCKMEPMVYEHVCHSIGATVFPKIFGDVAQIPGLFDKLLMGKYPILQFGTYPRL